MDSENRKLAVDAAAAATQSDELPLPRPHMDDNVYFRSLYRDRLDFRALARDDSDLAAVIRDGHLDFRDPVALRQLTKTLLERDFGLRILLPPDRLCPPVPNRHNYVLWIKELLDSSMGDGSESDVARCAFGLDIGTGASCIYPLLGCAQRRGWQFLATDIDSHSLAAARANVERNGLASRVRIVARHPSDTLLPSAFFDWIATADNRVPTFVMTNPPFYASMDDVAAGALHKEAPPRAACTGAPVEMVYKGDGCHSDETNGDGGGGEVSFVLRLLDESAAAAARAVPALPPVCWFSAMLGKRSSLAAVVTALRTRGLDNYAVAVFAPGGGNSSNSGAKTTTRRWAVAWSYGARRPAADVARGGRVGDTVSSLASIRQLLPPSTEAVVWRVATSKATAPACDSNNNGVKDGPGLPVADVSGRLDKLLQGLALTSWVWDARRLHGVGKAAENVWGRAWRRRAQRGETAAKATAGAIDTALGFVVTVRAGVAESTVACRWAEGHSEALFQSFCGFLQTQLAAG